MAFGVAHGKSHLRPFPKWHVSAFLHLGCPLSLPPPPVHHRPIDPPDSASGPGRMQPRAPASPPRPSPRSGMWAPRHRLPPVEDWLAMSSDQRQQAGHAHGGWCAIHKAGWPLHTLPCLYQHSGSGLAWTRTPRVWITHAHFVANPSRDFPLVLTDAPGLENKS